MKRNKYVCVATSVNPNQATSYNEFANSLRDQRNFEEVWEDFKRQIITARTK